MRQTNRERLNQAREIFCVTGIAQPREGIRDDVEKSRARERSGQQRFQRRAIGDKEPEAPDQEQREIAASDERIEERRAVMNVQDDVRKEERNEWDGEFVFAREINRAAKGDRGERREVREPGRARSNGESRHDPVGDGGEDEKECGNHRDEF